MKCLSNLDGRALSARCSAWRLFRLQVERRTTGEVFHKIRDFLTGQKLVHTSTINILSELTASDRSEIQASLREDPQQVFDTLCAMSSKFAFLLLPPGTGKTHTIAVLARTNSLQGRQTAVTAASNTAVNVLTAKIITEFGKHQIDPRRITRWISSDVATSRIWEMLRHDHSRPGAKDSTGPIEASSQAQSADNPIMASMRSDLVEYLKDKRIPQELIRFTLEAKFFDWIKHREDDLLSTLVEEKLNNAFADTEDGEARKGLLAQKIKELPASIVNASDVIAHTLITSETDGRLEDAKIHMAAVDEAAFCLEPELLCAIAAYPNSAFLICGDPNQFPPIVTSSSNLIEGSDKQRSKAKLVDYEEADPSEGTTETGLLRRTQENKNELANQLRHSFMRRMVMDLDHPCVTLHKQARSHPDIRLLWDHIYSGSITDADIDFDNQPSAQTFRKWAQDRYGVSKNYIVIDVDGTEATRAPASTSRYNDRFLAMGLEIIQSLVKYHIAPEDILIISPYLARKDRYNLMLKEANIHITASSIDGAQGGEKDVVLLELVHAGDAPSYLVKDWRHLNVALSRSKSGLIAIGDSSQATQELAPLQVKLQEDNNISKEETFPIISNCDSHLDHLNKALYIMVHEIP